MMFSNYTKQDANAFAIAVLPLILLIAGYFLSERVVSSMGIIVLVLAWADRKELKKQDKPAPSFWWGIISPVYLWKRDAWQQQPKRLFQLWMVAMLISVAGTVLQLINHNTSALAESACPTVTAIMKEHNNSAVCISITDMHEEVAGRFWKAKALMNTGKKMAVTIELQKNGQFYVTVPNINEAY